MKAQPLVESLHQVQSDATVFQQKMRHFHWNVRGPQFFTLHIEFEKLYTRWQTLIDDVAERVLQLGGVPVGTLAGSVQKSKIKEVTEIPDAMSMVSQTVTDLKAQFTSFKHTITVAEEADDRPTADLMDAIADETAKMIWMFEAFSKA